jgi:ankyrin repeat protein
MEFAALLPKLSVTQREELWNFSYDFYHVEAVQLESLRALLSQLENKVTDNLLLPEEQKHELTSIDKALLSIIPYNYKLLAWITQRYEFIICTSKPLTQLIINHGLTVNVGRAQFKIGEVNNFAYFMSHKTDALKDNRGQLQNKLSTDLFGDEELESPILSQIKKGELSACKDLISKNPEVLTLVDWSTGNSLLALAAEQGDQDLCQWLMKHGAPLYHRNKEGKRAEELWPLKPSIDDLMTYLAPLNSLKQYWRAQAVGENPITTFRKDTIRLARDHQWLSLERKEELWSLILTQNSNLLTYIIDERVDANNFLYHAMMENKEPVIKRLTEHEQWPLWSNLRHLRGYTLLHIIARENHTALYPYLHRIDINDVNNECRRSPLSCAAYEGSVAFCSLLVSKGARLDLQDINGNTALARASMRGHEQVCILLIKQGARIHVKNNEGQTAETLWPSSSNSPFTRLHNEIYGLALHEACEFTNEQEALFWLILVDNPRLLFLSLKPSPEKRNFLEIVFARNNLAVINRLRVHEQWPEWSKIQASIKLDTKALEILPDNSLNLQGREHEFERKKTEILQILDRDGPRALWGFFKANSVLDDLYQRIRQARLGFTPPHSLTATHVLEEVMFQWECAHSSIEGQKHVRFFSEDCRRNIQIEETIDAIKELLSPGKEHCQNRV